MAVNSKHPLYAHYADDWKMMTDAYGGERLVKARGTVYLPPTSGMDADGMNPDQKGWKAYQAYKSRAVFPDYVADAVEALAGVMHRKPAKIEVPSVLKPMIERASTSGESAQLLLQRITEQQLVYGRLGLLLDLPETPVQGTPTPYIALYSALSAINWDKGALGQQAADKLSLVVLDETEHELMPDSLEWELVEKYRMLRLMPKGGGTTGKPVYQVAVVRRQNDTIPAPSAWVVPSYRGKVLEEIPFVFVNSKDVVVDPDDPPLLGLAQICMTIYRGEADYRQTLFMQGQDTLVVIGALTDGLGQQGEVRVGANARLDLPVGGDAKYIGVGHQGLAEQRQAIEADRTLAGQKGAQLLDNRSREKEGHESLQIRVAARTATLTQIAKASAFGLEQILKCAARWAGASEKEVLVVPNLDFVDEVVSPADMVDLISAKNQGFPLSRESLHGWAVKHEMTTLTYEEELDLIEGEEPIGTVIGAPLPDDNAPRIGIDPPEKDDE